MSERHCIEVSSPVRVVYRGSAFGDKLLAAGLVQILNDNGLPAVFYDARVRELVDVPLYEPGMDIGVTFNAFRRHRRGHQTRNQFDVYSDLVQTFADRYGVRTKLEIDLDSVPVRFQEIEDVGSVDVAMVTQTGNWTLYRSWPYFDELKGLLREHSISFIDLSTERIRNIRFLNWVKNAHLFLGLDTGASHYASRFANDKALIIQSGYSPFRYWAGRYRYRAIEVNVGCAPCRLRSGCPFGHRCMRAISPEAVFRRIKKRLRSR